jgi:hypothetical protein
MPHNYAQLHMTSMPSMHIHWLYSADFCIPNLASTLTIASLHTFTGSINSQELLSVSLTNVQLEVTDKGIDLQCHRFLPGHYYTT